MPRLFVGGTFPANQATRVREPNFVQKSLLVRETLLNSNSNMDRRRRTTRRRDNSTIKRNNGYALYGRLLSKLNMSNGVRRKNRRSPNRRVNRSVNRHGRDRLLLTRLTFLRIRLLKRRTRRGTRGNKNSSPTPPKTTTPKRISRNITSRTSRTTSRKTMRNDRRNRGNMLRTSINIKCQTKGNRGASRGGRRYHTSASDSGKLSTTIIVFRVLSPLLFHKYKISYGTSLMCSALLDLIGKRSTHFTRGQLLSYV